MLSAYLCWGKKLNHKWFIAMFYRVALHCVLCLLLDLVSVDCAELPDCNSMELYRQTF